MCIFDTHPQRFLCVWKIRMIDHPKEDYRSILFADINRLAGTNTRRHQKRQGWNASNLPAVKVMNLNQRLFITQRKNFAYVSLWIDNLRE